MEKLSQRSKLSQDKLLGLIKKLSPKLEDAYFSFEIIEVLESIANRYKFNEEESQEFAGIVYDILLGFLAVDNINEELARRIKLEGDKLGFVRGELDSFIVNKLNNDIDEAYGSKKNNSSAGKKNSDKTKTRSDSDYLKHGAVDPYRESIE